MRINHRISRLEERSLVGFDRDGHCRYCHGREKELGGQVVVRRPNDPPPELTARFQSPRPDPGPTPCPRCGRDLNTYVHINYVNRLPSDGRGRVSLYGPET